MHNSAPEFAIVMPVYNEQESVELVVREWMSVLPDLVETFVFLAIDDGSKDETLGVLKRLAEEFGERLIVISRSNKGHGASCIEGYQWACKENIPYVFQIDSDGQCDPRFFAEVWEKRHGFDVIYGLRVHRDDGWRRILASKILLLTIFLKTGLVLPDANVPYRLMKTERLGERINKVPEDFFLANVALAILLKRAGWKHGFVKIHFRNRHGGEPSVPLGKFQHRAAELIRQIDGLSK